MSESPGWKERFDIMGGISPNIQLWIPIYLGGLESCLTAITLYNKMAVLVLLTYKEKVNTEGEGHVSASGLILLISITIEVNSTGCKNEAEKFERFYRLRKILEYTVSSLD